MWEIINTNNSLLGEPEGNNYVIDLSVEGRIILKWSSRHGM
jgi:hypothetical protein